MIINNDSIINKDVAHLGGGGGSSMLRCIIAGCNYIMLCCVYIKICSIVLCYTKHIVVNHIIL